ncbi:MAG TPA: YncE family protein, partial [Bacteroidales bacterium]|nr:YncE family protein [Bacteroidales bacterium]
MRRDWRLLLGLLWLFTSACRDEKPLPQPEPAGNERMYVLNEGLFNMNNSTITLFDPESRSALTDYFEITNGRKMGDTGNDMAIYGGKLYVVLSGSSQVEVMAAATGKSLRQIPLFDGQRARQPRAIAFLDRHAFIACFDGTVIALDTASLQITGMAIAGSNPDGITVAGGKLYVSNSGGLNFPHYDNT